MFSIGQCLRYAGHYNTELDTVFDNLFANNADVCINECLSHEHCDYVSIYKVNYKSSLPYFCVFGIFRSGMKKIKNERIPDDQSSFHVCRG